MRLRFAERVVGSADGMGPSELVGGVAVFQDGDLADVCEGVDAGGAAEASVDGSLHPPKGAIGSSATPCVGVNDPGLYPVHDGEGLHGVFGDHADGETVFGVVRARSPASSVVSTTFTTAAGPKISPWCTSNRLPRRRPPTRALGDSFGPAVVPARQLAPLRHRAKRNCGTMAREMMVSRDRAPTPMTP